MRQTSAIPQAAPLAGPMIPSAISLKNALHVVTLMFAVQAVGLYLFVALSTLAYPYELEWMEGGSVDATMRVQQGLPLYTAPSPDWVAMLYGPGYFYTAAAVAPLLGTSLFSHRVISLLASLACMAILYRWVRRESGQPMLGVLAIALFSGSFTLSGAWYHLARVDTLALAFMLAALYSLRFGTTRREALIASVLALLAFHTKQSALMPVAAAAIGFLLIDWRRVVWFALPLGAMLALTIGILDRTTQGWFSFTALQLNGDIIDSVLVPSRLITVWTEDLAPLLPAFFAACLYWIFVWRKQGWRISVYVAALSAGMIAAGIAARARDGGYNNVLLPTLAFVALFAPLAFNHILTARPSLSPFTLHWMRIGLHVLLFLQMLSLVYNPFHYIPDAEDRQAGDALIRLIREQPGDVLMVGHGNYTSLAGKSCCSLAFVSNIQAGLGDHPQKQAFSDLFVEGIRAQRWSAIIEDDLWHISDHERIVLAEYYTPQRIHYETGQAFRPVTGMGTRPVTIWLPR